MNLNEKFAESMAEATKALEAGDLEKGKQHRQQAEMYKAALDELKALDGMRAPMRPPFPAATPAPEPVKVPAEVKDAGPLYKSFGDFLLDVAKSAQGPANRKMEELRSADPLDENGYNVAKALGDSFVGSVYQAMKAPTGLNETLGSAGGFLVGTDRSSALLSRMYDVGELLRRVDITPISAASNGMTFYAENESSRADGSRRGGIRGYWTAEAGDKTASQPEFREMELKLKKVVGLVYATDELLADAVALEAWITRNLPEELRFKVEDAIINGTGAGMPLGILNSAAIVTVSKQNLQAVDTVVYENVVDMYSRMWARSLPRAVWYINQNVWPQLYRMSLDVGTGGSAAFLPPNGLAAAPFGTLMGRPVVPLEYCDTVGDVGDIIFADLGEYQMIEKGGIQSASSIHVKFTNDETCFRFVYRCDGQPKWNSVLTPKNSAATVSPFVVLEAR